MHKHHNQSTNSTSYKIQQNFTVREMTTHTYTTILTVN